jgi:DNA-binding MarR family transcriptional regulator
VEEIPDSAVRAAHELRITFSRLRRRLREVGDFRGLTPSQTSVLSRLDRGGPATLSDLAAAERIRPQSMAATLAAIEERGLIARTPDPTDGRRQQIALTPAGHAMVDGSRRVREEWLARAFTDDYSEAERQCVREALSLLDRLADR